MRVCGFDFRVSGLYRLALLGGLVYGHVPSLFMVSGFRGWGWHRLALLEVRVGTVVFSFSWVRVGTVIFLVSGLGCVPSCPP